MKEKKLRRRLPVDPYELGALEHWLGDMAREGWQLEKLSGWSARFKQGEPQSRRYRFSPYQDKRGRPDRTEQELFEEMGWEFVTSLYNHFAVYSTADPAAPELSTDPVVESEAFRALDKRLRKARFAWIICAPIILFEGMIFDKLLYGDFFLRVSLPMLFAGGFEVTVLYVLYFVPVVWDAFQSSRKICALRRRLTLGEGIDHEAPYPARRKWLTCGTWRDLMLVLFVLLCIWAVRVPKIDLAGYTDPIAAPLLSEMEGEGFAYETGYSDKMNTVQFRATLLSEEFCETRQSGKAASGLLWLESTYVRPRIASFAEPLFDALVRKALKDESDETIFGEAVAQPLTDARFDEITYYYRQKIFKDGTEGSRLHVIAARRGKQVLLAEYTGEQPLSALLDEIDAAFARFG